MSFFYVVSRWFFSEFFEHLFIVSTCVVVGELMWLPPPLWVLEPGFVSLLLLKVAGIVIIFASLPYCRIGCIYGLYVALLIQGCPICFLPNFWHTSISLLFQLKFCLYFMHFSSKLNRINYYRDAHNYVLNGFEFHENQHSESHILLRSIHEFLSLLSKLSVWFVCNEVCPRCCSSLVSFMKSGPEKAALFLWA